MATLFKLHLSTPKDGFVSGPVPSIITGLRAYPDSAAVAECLPHYYRKAWAKAGTWWADKHDDNKPLHVALYGSRGKYLNTIYAMPYEFEAKA